MKRVFSKLILLNMSLYIIIQCMEVDKKLPADPSIPDPSGICWLALLSVEVQDHIASFFADAPEKVENFSERLKKLCEEKHKGERSSQKIPNKMALYEVHNRSVIKNYDMKQIAYSDISGSKARMIDLFVTYRNEYTKKELLYQSQNNEEIAQIGLALNNKYLIILTKAFANYNVLNLYLINLSTKICNKIPLSENIFLEKVIVFTLSDLLLYINKGYSYTACGDQQQPQFTLSNLISLVAVSNDGKKIALSNNRTIFLIEQDKTNKDKWDCKTIEQQIFQKVDELPMNAHWPQFWHWPIPACIDFNCEGTHLGIGYNNRDTVANKITIQEIGKKPYCSLWAYFRSHKICKDLPAACLIFLEKNK